MIKALIFDMDGLLVDTEKLYNRFWRESAKDFGYDMSYEDALSIRSMTAVYATKKMQKRFGKEFPYDKIKEHRRVLMQTFVEKEGVEIKEGAKALLEYAKKNAYKIALATASPKRRAERYLKGLEIYSYFDVIVCGTDVAIGKPEPDIYLMAVAKLGLKAEDCIALEDSPNGIIAAHRAGCLPVMVPDLDKPEEEIKNYLYGCVETLDLVIPLLHQ